MVFRTELNLNKSSIRIDYHHNILLIGSCFSDNIGDRLQKIKIQTLQNPFGTVYNAFSIAKLLDYAVNLRYVTKENLVTHLGIYAHPDFHGIFNNTEAEKVVQNINAAILTTHDTLKITDMSFVTLGTSWVYKTKDKNEIVSNCHKLPQRYFEKELLSMTETKKAIDDIISSLKILNPQNQVLFTVSPVRHIKDGIIENQVSKAILIQAVFDTVSQLNARYFPSYELMMDDLRDYRFYKEDLIHPSVQAIEYIWEKFVTHYFSDKSIEIKSKIEKINAFLQHRPHVTSEDYFTRLEKIKQELLDINLKYNLSIVLP